METGCICRRTATPLLLASSDRIMTNTHILYGWQLSYFSGKTRAYLRYKNIDLDDRPVNALTLMRKIPAKTGAMVMPVVVTPQGEWLQDSSHIVDVLEDRFTDKPVMSGTPRQAIAAQLLEAWADEFWIPSAMHYRWSYPGNYPLFQREAGQALLPWAPRWLQNRLADRIAGTLRSYLPGVGVEPQQVALLERWTIHMLDALERHFAEHDYLLGGAPSIADFALVGPLYAHLGRDPEPLRLLIEPRPRLQAWIQRVAQGVPASGSWLADDALPDTLRPVLHSVLQEFLPMADATVQAMDVALATLPPQRKRLPRSLQAISFPLADGQFQRQALPYVLWMLQRVQRFYAQLDAADQNHVQAWLDSQAAGDIMTRPMGPALRRQGLHVCLTEQPQTI